MVSKLKNNLTQINRRRLPASVLGDAVPATVHSLSRCPAGLDLLAGFSDLRGRRIGRLSPPAHLLSFLFANCHLKILARLRGWLRRSRANGVVNVC